MTHIVHVCVLQLCQIIIFDTIFWNLGLNLCFLLLWLTLYMCITSLSNNLWQYLFKSGTEPMFSIFTTHICITTLSNNLWHHFILCGTQPTFSICMTHIVLQLCQIIIFDIIFFKSGTEPLFSIFMTHIVHTTLSNNNLWHYFCKSGTEAMFSIFMTHIVHTCVWQLCQVIFDTIFSDLGMNHCFLFLWLTFYELQLCQIIFDTIFQNLRLNHCFIFLWLTLYIYIYIMYYNFVK